MQIRVVAPDDVAAVGATLVTEALAAAAAAGRSGPTLMPALGTSALGLYRELGRRAGSGEVDLTGLRLVQLDEYEGLPESDPRLLYGWLRRDVAGPLHVPDSRIIRIGDDGLATDDALAAYDRAVETAGGIDVAVLGLGPNGHLGFNEPPSGVDAPTRVVRLSEASRVSNARYWPGLPVPDRALTAGMPTILRARTIVLVVTGPTKRAILRPMLTGPSGPDLPASYLRDVPTAILLADVAAWPDDVPRPSP